MLFDASAGNGQTPQMGMNGDYNNKYGYNQWNAAQQQTAAGMAQPMSQLGQMAWQGKGPSVAGAQATQAMNAANANASRAATGTRGGQGLAAAQLGANTQAAQQGGAINQQAGQARLQEQQHAANQLMQAQMQQRAQDLAAAGMDLNNAYRQAGLELGQSGLNQTADIANNAKNMQLMQMMLGAGAGAAQAGGMMAGSSGMGSMPPPNDYAWSSGPGGY